MRFTFIILLFCCLGVDAQMIIKAHANYRPLAQPVVNLLLDDYPNAAAAYSLRKLDKDYTGSAIRVRRSNDNTEQDIGFTSSGDLDTGALKTFVGANSGFVTAWYNQSAGRNIFNSNASNQPIIVLSGVIYREKQKPTIIFNEKFLGNDTISFPLINRSFFIVMKQIEILQNTGIIGLNPSGSQNDFSAVDAFVFSTQNTALNRQYAINGMTSTAYNLQKNGSGNIINHSILSEIKNGGSANLYENGVSVASDNSYSEFNTNSNPGFVIGARYLTNNSILFRSNISVQEFIYWGANQSSNRTGIENNINSYYVIY
jgi:hypothetical protein